MKTGSELFQLRVCKFLAVCVPQVMSDIHPFITMCHVTWMFVEDELSEGMYG
jgi:hypothetical protein